MVKGEEEDDEIGPTHRPAEYMSSGIEMLIDAMKVSVFPHTTHEAK